MLLQDKVVIISGIGPGLGIKLALNAAREGAKAVVFAARTEANLHDAEAQVRALGTDCQTLTVPTDICDRSQCDGLVTSTLAAFGRIDALVNSAFLHGKFEPIESADLDDWRETVNTNLIGTMNMSQAVIPAMKAQNSGAMVMINTMAVRKPYVLPIGGESGYAASKSALATAVKYLAEELGRYGIRVNSAHMGWIWGKPVRDYVRYTAKRQQVTEQQVIDGITANIPLDRISTDDDCARAALFLVSDYATAITGASLDVNGGEYMPA